jgi:two-component system sensor histidine kinase KdpD
MGGFVSTLLTNHERIDPETRQRMLERVDVATARLSGLIDQLLMLSRLEAGVVTATLEPVLAVTVLEQVKRQSENPDAVVLSGAADFEVTTDAALLTRALGFLVDNALKYAGSCEIVAGDATIQVIDHGPGIPSEDRAHMFERFTRANLDTTVAGMGIGLPMARTLLAATGADLVYEAPADGLGTRMVIRFS